MRPPMALDRGVRAATRRAMPRTARMRDGGRFARALRRGHRARAVVARAREAWMTLDVATPRRETTPEGLMKTRD